MQRWEYQTLTARQGKDEIMMLTHVNGKESEHEVTGGILKSKAYTFDLPSYLGKAGREGWEVVGMTSTTAFGAGSGVGEGAVNVVVILKRPVE